MRRVLLLSLLLVSPGSPAADAGRLAEPPAVADGFHQIKLNGHTFTLPAGFTIELAAAPPLADRPIVAALDEKGRLYVCDSSGSNAKVTEQMKTKPHRIMRLEDTNGDGAYDKSTAYVPNVMFPEGAMWLNGSLYVAAPPNILKFTDTNDDGVADKEEIWFDGTKVSPTIGGCANDLHGPYLGPDGWIYWTKGGFEKQTYTVNGKPFVTKAAHIFRARPDGTGIEPVMTGGMDNPVDVVFTPSGERIFSCTFLQHPANGKRDGLIHAVYGAVYGKDHAPIYDHPWTSPHLMEPMTHLGPAAPCGLHRYESDQFGKDYENNLFCCQFNLRKVSRHVLVPKGSTFVTKDSDFVVSDQMDFHPTDVIEDADGSLLILDTGGWYKLCCPSSQLVKPDVKGAIYRVKKIGSHKVEDPRGEKIEWAKLKAEDLVKLLGDPRPVVRWRAISELARQGDSVVDALLQVGIKEQSQRVRLGAVWALCRIDSAGARIANRAFFRSRDDAREAAICAASLHREEGSSDFLTAIVTDAPTAQSGDCEQRVAAEALGRMCDPKTVPALLEALADGKNDRGLDHSLTFALIEIGDVNAIKKGLAHQSPRVRRSALVALDRIPADLRRSGEWHFELLLSNGQKSIDFSRMTPDFRAYARRVFESLDIPNPSNDDTFTKDQFLAAFEKGAASRGSLTVVEGIKFLDSTDIALRETTWWIASRHPGWGGSLVQHFTAQLNNAAKLTATEREELADRLAKFTKSEAVQKMLSKSPPGVESKRVILRAMARSGLKALPKNWEPGIADALVSKDESLRKDALTVIQRVQSTRDFSQLLKDLKIPPEPGKGGWTFGFHLQVQAAAPPGTFTIDAKRMPEFATWLDRNQPPEIRAAAAEVIARSTITAEGLQALAPVLKSASALDLPKILAVFAKSKEEAVGLALVAVLMDVPVRVEVVKPVLEKYPPAVQAAAEKLYAKLAEARKDDIAKLERLVKELPAGDVRRGQAIFNGAKAQCAACHKIGYVGGMVGPDLTKIGGIRTDRDLLESIVFPSASFVRSYEPVWVVTKSDRVLSGIVKSESPDEIVLTIAADKEERIARTDVESISPGTVSVMPDGLDKQLTPQELADLVAFLRANK